MKTVEKLLRTGARPFAPIPTGRPPVTPLMPDVRAVIFDVYGTLFLSAAGDIGVATAADAEPLFREALTASGLHVLPMAEKCQGVDVWRGRIRAHHAMDRARGIDCPEVEIRAIWRETLAVLMRMGAVAPALVDDALVEAVATRYEIRTNPVWPMPGARETLDALRRSGRTLGIVSNAQFFTPCLFDAFLDASVSALGFAAPLCVWSYCCGEAKPSPRLFAQVVAGARSFGIEHAAQLLYVGNDMLNDIWAARQAGMRTALFAGDQRSLRSRADDPRCRNLQPDAVITQLTMIPRMLGLDRVS